MTKKREERETFGPEMEGEGNKSADRHYREKAEKHASHKGESRRAAKRAEKALEGEEGRDLEEARKRSKSHEPGGRF